MIDPEKDLAAFIAEYTPEIAELGRSVIGELHRRLPTATQIVYDNYNALVVGFGPDDRPSNAIMSVALYPKWVSLFFLQASRLDDPDGVLKGSGVVARHVVLDSPADLDRADLCALMEQALAKAKVPLPGSGGGGLIIRSVSAKQRPRRR